MWSAPQNPIPRSQIRTYYIGVLERAVSELEEEDISQNREVFEALDYLESAAPVGVRNFRKALNSGDARLLKLGLYMITRLI